MIGENLTPAADRSIAGDSNPGGFPAGGFDLRRFTVEVANEIGVQPNRGAFGMSSQEIGALEAQTHSRTRRGGNR
ncbi:MAG: hypothetical protein JWN15_4271 [Firmicutes bacterium]|jgi:hypothetical protein|nr:hypothetical protein [Bacillota bacterium]